MRNVSRSFAITLCALALTTSGMASTEERVQKTLPAQPGGKLVVEVDFGSIEVVGTSDSVVKLDAWRKVSRLSKSQEQAFLKNRPIEISSDDGVITIRSRAKSRESWLRKGGNTEGRYILRVPQEFAARLSTAGGGIKVGKLDGKVEANTSGGGLDFSEIQGDVTGRTAGGGISAADCKGKLAISTSGGGIKVTGGSGELNGTTAGGGVTVKGFRGPAVVRTSGGGITIDGVTGAIEGVTAGGSISAALPVEHSGRVKLSSSGGGITIRLPEGSAFDLDASTSAGGVSCEFPISVAGKIRDGHLKGSINGGGQPLELQTAAGSIEVRKL